ncbi:AAA family ATPase [Lentzea albida]|uniref:Regulatory protein, luxR family n=1 Tax=Lentzea albida TaxID=65499 RepID=A0A1H9X5Y0_9PSEU|nr:AAA family ATPase [Lentzea albida]SES41555.1 regulatory protein, luxR family [Lentzea albida]
MFPLHAESSPVLVEREAEISALEDFLTDLSSGRSAAVAVVGPPGSGRSALLSHAVHHAAWLGLRTAIARARPSEKDVEWGVAAQWRDCLRSDWIGWPALDRVGPARKDGVLMSVCSAVVAMARRAPLLLVVDDVHLSDQSSADLLAALLRRLRQGPLGIVFATNGEHRFDQVCDDLVHTLLPRPLTAAGVDVLCRQHFDDDAVVAALVSLSAGMPGILVPALADAALPAGAPRRLRAIAAAEAHRRAATDRVLACLPPEALHLARLICVARGDLHLTELCVAAGTRGIPGSTLQLLRDNGLLDGAPDRPTLTDIAAEQVLAGMSPRARHALHAATAAVAHGAAAPQETVARLLLGADTTGTTWAADVSRRCGGRALREGDDRTAAAWLTRAARESADEVERSRLALELARAHTRDRPVACTRALSVVAMGSHHRAEAVDLLLLRGEMDAVCRSTVAANRHDDPELHGLRRIAALALGRGTGDPVDDRPERNPVLAGTEAWRLALVGDDATRVRELAAIGASDHPHVSARLVACAALVLADDLDEARAALDDVLTTALRRGARAAAAAAAFQISDAAHRAGRLDDAGHHLDLALDLLPLGAWSRRNHVLPVSARARLELDRGNIDGARDVLALADPAAEPGWGNLLHARAAVALASGDPEEALRDLLACGRRLTGRGWHNPAVLDWRSPAAEALCRLERTAEARVLLADGRRAAARWGTASCVGAARLAAGRWGGVTSPVRTFAQAERVLRRSCSRLLHVEAQVELAFALLPLGESGEAAWLAQQAVRTARGHAAQSLALRAEAVRTTAEEKAVPDGTRRGDAVLSVLSQSQAKAARSVLLGLSNAEIASASGITRRAVELQLTAAYRKLGVAGRGELVDLLTGR